MKTKKLLTGLTTILIASSLFAGCGSTNNAAKTENSGQESKLSGSITMSGSTSMEKIANALSESFMQDNPGVTVSAEFVGSSAGIEAVNSKTVDIGNASRKLKDSEKSKGAVENIVAIDGIAIVTDKANTVKNLTQQQLTDIYTGSIKDWSEVGGQSSSIVVVGREAGSGTRGAFEEMLKIEDKCMYSNELDSTGAAMAKAGSTPGAIAYVSLDSVNDTVKTINIDGIEPTEDNIKSGKYSLQRPFVMATNGDIDKQNELVQAWFAYVESDAGKEIVKKVGLIVK